MAFSEKLKGMLVSLQPPGDITAFTELFKSDTLDVGTASSVKKKTPPLAPWYLPITAPLTFPMMPRGFDPFKLSFLQTRGDALSGTEQLRHIHSHFVK